MSAPSLESQHSVSPMSDQHQEHVRDNFLASGQRQDINGIVSAPCQTHVSTPSVPCQRQFSGVSPLSEQCQQHLYIVSPMSAPPVQHQHCVSTSCTLSDSVSTRFRPSARRQSDVSTTCRLSAPCQPHVSTQSVLCQGRFCTVHRQDHCSECKELKQLQDVLWLQHVLFTGFRFKLTSS